MLTARKPCGPTTASRRHGRRGFAALLLALLLALPAAAWAEGASGWHAISSEGSFLGAAPLGLVELGRQSGGKAIVISPTQGAAPSRIRLWDELGRPRTNSPLRQGGTATSTSRSMN